MIDSLIFGGDANIVATGQRIELSCVKNCRPPPRLFLELLIPGAAGAGLYLGRRQDC
jgi:hypothetical protein